MCARRDNVGKLAGRGEKTHAKKEKEKKEKKVKLFCTWCAAHSVHVLASASENRAFFVIIKGEVLI